MIALNNSQGLSLCIKSKVSWKRVIFMLQHGHVIAKAMFLKTSLNTPYFYKGKAYLYRKTQ
jgi:hypothetical protein